MIPVEDGKTSATSHPKVEATFAQTSLQALMPASPVAQFAFPAFTAMARTRPADCSRCSRPTMIGAATTRLLVNIAAAEALLSATAMAKSGFPLGLRPAVTAANRNPDGSRKSGRCGEEIIADFYCINRRTRSRRGEVKGAKH